uniref:Uncharacterized protein n=1 Tax=Magallana gigas TaxID=29159 RepID=A0A8W8M2U2_MAGGI
MPHPPRETTAANHTPLLNTQVLEEKLSPFPLPPPQKLVTHLQHVEYSYVKVISTEIGVTSREPCYNFVVTVTLSDLELHWLHTL